MTQPNISTVMPILHGLGLTPDKLSPSKMEQLENLVSQFGNVDSITPELTRKVMDIFGIGPVQKMKPRYVDVKIGRNERCPCESGKKYKKCCGIN